MTLSRSLATFGVGVRTTMPSATGVVHEAGVPRRPSISTRQSRQEPNASRLSVAHNLGTLNSAGQCGRPHDGCAFGDGDVHPVHL